MRHALIVSQTFSMRFAIQQKNKWIRSVGIKLKTLSAHTRLSLQALLSFVASATNELKDATLKTRNTSRTHDLLLRKGMKPAMEGQWNRERQIRKGKRRL
jgi:hypothetical protein